MRPVTLQDAPLLVRLFEGLSPLSRYQRFMQHLRALPPDLLQRFTRVDYERSLALVVFEPEGREIIGVGRYAPGDGQGNAEFALTVADAWQARGIGRILLERLCELARTAGYRALYGRVLDDNHKMLDLATRLGFTRLKREGSELIVVRPL